MIACLRILATILCALFATEGWTQDHSVYDHPLMESENPSQDHFITEFINMLVILSMTLLVMLAIAWVLKRFLHTRLQQGNAVSTIKVEDRRNLGPRSMVYLLEVEGVRLIVGESPNGLVKLGELPASAKPFSKLMDQP